MLNLITKTILIYLILCGKMHMIYALCLSHGVKKPTMILYKFANISHYAIVFDY